MAGPNLGATRARIHRPKRAQEAQARRCQGAMPRGGACLTLVYASVKPRACANAKNRRAMPGAGNGNGRTPSACVVSQRPPAIRLRVGGMLAAKFGQVRRAGEIKWSRSNDPDRTAQIEQNCKPSKTAGTINVDAFALDSRSRVRALAGRASSALQRASAHKAQRWPRSEQPQECGEAKWACQNEHAKTRAMRVLDERLRRRRHVLVTGADAQRQAQGPIADQEQAPQHQQGDGVRQHHRDHGADAGALHITLTEHHH